MILLCKLSWPQTQYNRPSHPWLLSAGIKGVCTAFFSVFFFLKKSLVHSSKTRKVILKPLIFISDTVNLQ